MVLSIINNWAEAEDDHKTYVKKIITNSLAHTSGKKYISNAWLRTYIDNHQDDIAVGKPDRLLVLARMFNDHKMSLSSIDAKLLVAETKKVFSYHRFSRKSGEWNAYSLVSKSQCHICPYCNQAFAFTVVTKRGAFRPTLDHYYSKDLHPLLAVSLNNLIPSCYTCNSNLKGTLDFYQKQHLHPMFDDERISFKLVGKNNVLNFIDAQHDMKTWLNLYKLESYSNNIGDIPALRSIETFLLNERFELNLPHLKDFIHKLSYFDKAKRKEYIDLFKDFPSESVILDFDKSNYKSQILGKIKLDIYNQIKLTQ